MEDGRGIEGAEAPVSGRDALGQRAFNVAVFTQPGQLERMGAHQPKQIVLPPPLFFPSLSLSALTDPPLWDGVQA